jgi:hypothetical protein
VSDDTQTNAGVATGEVAVRLAEIRQLPAAEYWRPETQAEELALIAGKSVSEARPAELRTAEGRELAEIRRVLRTDADRYNNDKAMQARHLELLEAKLGRKPTAAEIHWGELEPARQHGLRIVSEVKRDLQATGDWHNCESTFDGLSVDVHQAVENDLMWGPIKDAEPVSQKEVASFAETPVGRDLVAEWGDAAAEKIGQARARFWRIADQLNETDFEAALHWFDSGEPAEQQAIIRGLVRNG